MQCKCTFYSRAGVLYNWRNGVRETQIITQLKHFSHSCCVPHQKTERSIQPTEGSTSVEWKMFSSAAKQLTAKISQKAEVPKFRTHSNTKPWQNWSLCKALTIACRKSRVKIGYQIEKSNIFFKSDKELTKRERESSPARDKPLHQLSPCLVRFSNNLQCAVLQHERVCYTWCNMGSNQAHACNQNTG